MKPFYRAGNVKQRCLHKHRNPYAALQCFLERQAKSFRISLFVPIYISRDGKTFERIN